MAKEEQIILITEIPREKGWLYYTKTNEKGNVILCKAQAGRKVGAKRDNGGKVVEGEK